MRPMQKMNTKSKWVQETLGKMTLEERIGQLLVPVLRPSIFEEAQLNFSGIQPGGIHFFAGPVKDNFRTIEAIKKAFPLPMLICADLENGPGNAFEEQTVFPRMMAIAATDSEEYAYLCGKAAGMEGRACGLHWTFTPVLDVAGHPHAPITSVRTLGDDPKRIARLARAHIRGIQDHGMCASAKHFPGDGFDDRDSHLCTTVNPLSKEQWRRTSGWLYKEAIDEGVGSIMAGHIGLPAWDPGDRNKMLDTPPATLSKKVMTGLLREEMGFEGVIVTDAMGMGGVTSWGQPSETIPRAINAGCDVMLFSYARRDANILLEAVEKGKVTEERIKGSAERVLALKEALGLNHARDPEPVSETDKKQFAKVSLDAAEHAVTLVQDRSGALPFKLEKGSKVLCFHIRGAADHNADGFDDLLKERGCEVTRVTEEEYKNVNARVAAEHDIVLVPFVFGPNYGTNRIRPAGEYLRGLWNALDADTPNIAAISFGNPFHIYEFPRVPVYINAYSHDESSQKAVLKVLTGELKPIGKSPVDLNRPYSVIRFFADDFAGEES